MRQLWRVAHRARALRGEFGRERKTHLKSIDVFKNRQARNIVLRDSRGALGSKNRPSPSSIVIKQLDQNQREEVRSSVNMEDDEGQ